MKNEGGNCTGLGKMERPQGHLRGDGKDKGKDKERKESLGRMRQGGSERDDGKIPAVGLNRKDANTYDIRTCGRLYSVVWWDLSCL